MIWRAKEGKDEEEEEEEEEDIRNRQVGLGEGGEERDGEKERAVAAIGAEMEGRE